MKVPESQFDIEAIRKTYIGRKGKRRDGLYPVEHDPIRRHEHMTHGLNPLFLDPEYGKKSKYGTNIAPGVMTDYFAGEGTWPGWGGGPDIGSRASADPELDVPTLGDRAINLSTTWEFLAPVKIGDVLWSEPSIADVYVKGIKIDPRAVWVVNETRFYNQRNELVALSRNTGLRHRSPEEVQAEAAKA
ncbi:MAG: MaoC family dehydratase N-terminal domain-containing protein [Dehalococcoidia bacterium]